MRPHMNRRSILIPFLLVNASIVTLGCGDDASESSPSNPATDAGSDAPAADVEHPDADGGAPEASPDAPEGGPEGGTEIDTACSDPDRTFWMYNLSVMPPKYEQRPFVCRAASDHVRVWVSDAIWGDSVGEQEVRDVAIAMDHATPADPTAGIYDVATNVFGMPTDVDGDGAIHLLYDDLGQYQGTGFDGYIRREDMLGGANSNNAEVLYLDGARNSPAEEYMLGVIAHELQHMIHLNHDPDEAGWMDETLAEASMVAAGYFGDLHTWVANDFAKDPGQSLTVAPPTFNYGAGFLFGAYLIERFDPTFLTALVTEPQNGMAGLDAVLASQSVTRASLLADWAVANFLDAPSIDDGAYGYEAFEVPALSVPLTTLPVSDSTVTVQAAAAQYLLFDTSSASDGMVEGTLATAGYEALQVRTVVYTEGDPGTAAVGSVALGSPNEAVTISGVGGATDRVLLVLVNPSESPVDVTVSASLQ